MSYFTNFPTIGYIVDADNAKVVKAKNILVRAKFSDYVKKNDSLFFRYSIREGDRPDTIANTVYGRPDLHWLVLLMNEIINPYKEWPKTQAELDETIKLIYPGTTLYIKDDSILYDDRAITPDISFFLPDSVIMDVHGTEYTVVSYDSTLGKLVIVNSDSMMMENSEITVQANSVITQMTDNDKMITATVTKVEETPYAVHHFEDSDGNWLDPRTKYAPPVNPTVGVSYRPYSNIPKSLINLYADPNIDANGDPTEEALIVANQAVSNTDYFYAENDKKREIIILKPQFLDEIMKQFGDIFKPQ